jgi:glyoxylase-like metal-dependent hydrolase (beta-lactamase superfamily II)
MICHVLVVETEGGLVLVDTGLGTGDLADPRRLGRGFLLRSAPRLDPRETALAQVEALGFRRGDVRHIVATHLDLDHIGGIADFPDAEVHVLGAELDAALSPPRGRRYWYRPAQWAHGARWVRHAVDGEPWLGFQAVRAIPGLSTEILLVPLAGHSDGHAGVAVRTGARWLLHAGDAYMSEHEVDPVAPRSPAALALFQRRRATDNAKRLANQARLRQLVREHGAEVEIFCAHAAAELDRYTRADGRQNALAGAAQLI